MPDLSLPLLALLVNCGRVGLRRLWRLRRQAAWLVWGLWALVILSHLLGLAAGVGLVGPGTPLAASCSVRPPLLAVGSGVLGVAVGLWLGGEHGPAFPWSTGKCAGLCDGSD